MTDTVTASGALLSPPNPLRESQGRHPLPALPTPAQWVVLPASGNELQPVGKFDPQDVHESRESVIDLPAARYVAILDAILSISASDKRSDVHPRTNFAVSDLGSWRSSRSLIRTLAGSDAPSPTKIASC